jgi:erythromycin esterase-like protein/adenine/guanine phosphoribosyltransferase-like PRPP-binding protein
MLFQNRTDAGDQLAQRLGHYAGRSDVVVLALPRGGVPVASRIAAALGAPLDVFLVRKLGMPGHEELAIGAIAEGGIEVRQVRLIREIGLSQRIVDQVASRERLELDRRDQHYRGGRPRPDLRDRIVIVVDDGLATGATMEAAVTAIRESKPAQVIVAAPVGAIEAVARLKEIADEVVCVGTPTPFGAVGAAYADFAQTTDAEVVALLNAAHRLPARQPVPVAVRTAEAVELIRSRAEHLTGSRYDYDGLIRGIGDARLVLLGEATHGTHDFYRARAEITKRLIVEHGFAGVAVEADWPDAYRVNRYVRAIGPDRDGVEALSDFKRFPAWMWRNADVLDFVGWLREHNDTVPADARAGFYGLDLYSLHASMGAVLSYLARVDADAARRARARYACFDRFGASPQEYGRAAEWGLAPSCEREALDQVVDLLRRRAEYLSRDGQVVADDYFFAEQNARLVSSAEAYYRTMFRGRDESWNLRDRHMTDTLERLLTHLGRARRPARLVVWAHNSHLGDARATEMGEGGELNVGQLARERFGSSAVLVGFTTHHGTVTAAAEWDGPALRRHVRPALAGSIERLLHDSGIPRLLLPLRTDLELAAALAAPRLERAIGVLYLPASERRSHYFHAQVSKQFDYLVHLDETRAVEPLERTSHWEAGELAETYPSGL